MAPRPRPHGSLSLLLICWAAVTSVAGCAPPSGSATPVAGSEGDAGGCAKLLSEARRLVQGGDEDRAQLEWTMDEMAYRCDREFAIFAEEVSDGPRSQHEQAEVATPGSPPQGSISWSEAIDHVGSEKYVCGPLVNSGSSEDDVFLNLGRGYPDGKRFTVVLWDVGAIETPPEGVTLCARGIITTYEGAAQIEVRSVNAVEIWE